MSLRKSLQSSGTSKSDTSVPAIELGPTLSGQTRPDPAGVGTKTRRRVVAASFIGNFVEWFDYAVYGYLATTIATAFFPDERRAWSRARQAVIDADPSLQERELLKLSSLAVAMTRALRLRGIEDTAAALTAETGVAVFRVAIGAWIAEGEERSLAELQRAVLAELRSLVSTA